VERRPRHDRAETAVGCRLDSSRARSFLIAIEAPAIPAEIAEPGGVAPDLWPGVRSKSSLVVRGRSLERSFRLLATILKQEERTFRLIRVSGGSLGTYAEDAADRPGDHTGSRWRRLQWHDGHAVMM